MTSIPIITQGAPWPVTVFVKTKDTGVPLPLNGTLEVTLTKNGAATPFVTATLGSGIVSVNAAGGSLVLDISAASLASSGEGFGNMRIRRTDGTASIYVNYPVQFTINGPYPTDNDGTVVVPVRELFVTIASTVSPAVPPGSVSNTYLAPMPAGTVKANVSGASSAPSDVGLAALRTAMGAEVAGAGSAAVSAHVANPIAHPQYYHVRKRFKDFGLVGEADDSATIQAAFNAIATGVPFDLGGDSMRHASTLTLGGTSSATMVNEADIGGVLTLRPVATSAMPMPAVLNRQYISGSLGNWIIDAGRPDHAETNDNSIVVFADKFAGHGIVDRGVILSRNGYVKAYSLRGNTLVSFNDIVSGGAGIPTVGNINTFSHIHGINCGSGTHAAGAASSNLQTAFSNRVDGATPGIAQSCTFDVVTLPPSEFDFAGFTNPVCPIIVSFSYDGHIEKYTVVQIFGRSSGTQKVRIEPCPPDGVTGGTMRYYFGGALMELGRDSNINKYETLNVSGTGLALSGFSWYGPRASIHAANVGVAMVLGFRRDALYNGADIKAYIEGESAVDTPAYFLSQSDMTINNGFINFATLEQAGLDGIQYSHRYRLSAPGSPTTFGGKLETRGQPLEGWEILWRGQSLSQSTWPKNRQDSEANVLGVVTWDLRRQTGMPPVVRDATASGATRITLKGVGTGFNNVFGTDHSQLTVIGATGPNYQPKYSVEFTPPTGYKINGGAVDAMFTVTGLLDPTTFHAYEIIPNATAGIGAEIIITWSDMAGLSVRGANALDRRPATLRSGNIAVFDFVSGGYANIKDGTVTKLTLIDALPGIVKTNSSGGQVCNDKKNLVTVAANKTRLSYDVNGGHVGALFEAAHTYINGRSQPTVAQVPVGGGDAASTTDGAAPDGWSGTWIDFGDNSTVRTRRELVALPTGLIYFTALIRMTDTSAPVEGTDLQGGFYTTAALNPITGTAGALVEGPFYNGVYRVSYYTNIATAGNFLLGIAKLTTNSTKTFKVGPCNYGPGRYPPSMLDNVTTSALTRDFDVFKAPTPSMTANGMTLDGQLKIPRGVSNGYVSQVILDANNSLSVIAVSETQLRMTSRLAGVDTSINITGITAGATVSYAFAIDAATRTLRGKVSGVSAPSEVALSGTLPAYTPARYVAGSNDGAAGWLGGAIGFGAVTGHALSAAEIASWVG
jgi:hypothetical protein